MSEEAKRIFIKHAKKGMYSFSYKGFQSKFKTLDKVIIKSIQEALDKPLLNQNNMSKVIDVARKEIGVVESPKNSNKTKYGKWFGWDGVAWCGIFVSWVYSYAGKPLPNIGFTKGFAGCQTAVAYFKKNNKLVKTPIEGDIVFFDWNNDKRYDHTGIFVRDIDGLTFESIEGNTSISNQSNGGQVMLRKRKYSQSIFARPF